ncbi:hypothetical protein DRO64_07470 [Candidatus Bathyarchaeota archaeon]|nr:MAG: hypothetical protein DRO64_07470 [Candidatus Bathyarchaeota archaeon]
MIHNIPQAYAFHMWSMKPLLRAWDVPKRLLHKLETVNRNKQQRKEPSRKNWCAVAPKFINKLKYLIFLVMIVTFS